MSRGVPYSANPLLRIKLPALPPAAEAERRRLLESLIAKEKPAHTQFTLEIIH